MPAGGPEHPRESQSRESQCANSTRTVAGVIPALGATALVGAAITSADFYDAWAITPTFMALEMHQQPGWLDAHCSDAYFNHFLTATAALLAGCLMTYVHHKQSERFQRDTAWKRLGLMACLFVGAMGVGSHITLALLDELTRDENNLISMVTGESVASFHARQETWRNISYGTMTLGGAACLILLKRIFAGSASRMLSSHRAVMPRPIHLGVNLIANVVGAITLGIMCELSKAKDGSPKTDVINMSWLLYRSLLAASAALIGLTMTNLVKRARTLRPPKTLCQSIKRTAEGMSAILLSNAALSSATALLTACRGSDQDGDNTALINRFCQQEEGMKMTIFVGISLLALALLAMYSCKRLQTTSRHSQGDGYARVLSKATPLLAVTSTTAARREYNTNTSSRAESGARSCDGRKLLPN